MLVFEHQILKRTAETVGVFLWLVKQRRKLKRVIAAGVFHRDLKLKYTRVCVCKCVRELNTNISLGNLTPKKTLKNFTTFFFLSGGEI